VEKITYKCATRVYPNSYGLKDIILSEKLCPQAKLKVIANGSSNGIDTSFFNPALFSLKQRQNLRRELNINDDEFVVIFVGRLVSDKGINELVQNFNAVCNQFNNIKLLLVGAYEADLDPLKKETLHLINTNYSIISTGSQQDVRPYFAISDILVFPSYREGFPNVVMQAGAMELPSIVTNINGCNEIIVDGVNGLIIPPKDMNSLKEKMELLIMDIDLRNRLKQNERQMITSRYEQKMVWEALLAEYRSL
jgi:glycosyltransferase involved in cell wall biosynthesis